nr:hypothetical protein [Tanacetum cinerariifolium]
MASKGVRSSQAISMMRSVCWAKLGGQATWRGPGLLAAWPATAAPRAPAPGCGRSLSPPSP